MAGGGGVLVEYIRNSAINVNPSLTKEDGNKANQGKRERINCSKVKKNKITAQMTELHLKVKIRTRAVCL